MHTVQQHHQRITQGEASMKIIKDEPATLKRRRRITVELDHNDHLIGIKEGHYYRLGGQVEDVVQGHVLLESRGVYWCSITQKWEEV
jgi:hypothetical protein